MKRFFAFSQALVIVLLCLASCAVAPEGGGDTASTTVLKTSWRRDPAMYIKPPQKDHTPEEEQTIDYYYGELIRLYPRLARRTEAVSAVHFPCGTPSRLPDRPRRP